ncbi:hypothetical protein, partial [Microcoleus sp. B4-D1]|uniref:hypothetical protein n=1 Tax=Microcoleus sp. B4-D1 TaxID=2818666 RepID=UPI002FCF64EF
PAPCILKESVRRPSCHSGDRAVTQAIELSLRRPSCHSGDRAVTQAIELSLRRSSCHSGELTFFLVNLKKQESF